MCPFSHLKCIRKLFLAYEKPEHLSKITTAIIWKAMEGPRSAFYTEKKFIGQGPRWFQRGIRKRYTKVINFYPQFYFLKKIISKTPTIYKIK